MQCSQSRCLLVFELGQLAGVDADGLHVVENKVDLCQLRRDGSCEVLSN